MDNTAEVLLPLIEGGELVAAEHRARELLEENAENLEVRSMLARILAMQGKDDDAIELLRVITGEEPRNSYALSLLAKLLERKGEFDEALSLLNSAVRLKPNSSALHYQIGLIHKNPKYTEKNEYLALNNLRKAIMGDSPPGGAFIELASMEPDSRAIHILQNAVRIFPQDQNLGFALCERLYRSGEYSMCVQAVDDAKDRGIRSDDLPLLKTLSLYWMDQYKDALSSLDIPEGVDVRKKIGLTALRGLLMLESEEYMGAEELLEKVIVDDVINYLDFGGHIILICCYIRDSKIERADRVFKELPIESEFRPAGMFYFGEYLELDKYFLEALDGLISRMVASANKARFLRARYTYAWGSTDGKLTTAQLEELRQEFLASIDLLGHRNPRPYDSLYQVSIDLKDWTGAANYYFLGQILEQDEYSIEMDKQVLEAINRNQKNIEKLFTIIDQILIEMSYLRDRFAKRCLPELINFFHSKQKFDLVVRVAEKFSYSELLRAETVFEVAYAFAAIQNKKQAKSYYKAYLRDVGENSAVANNLSVLEEDSGNLSEAERLSKMALDLDPSSEAAKRNSARIMGRIQKDEEQKRAFEKAADLYRQELEPTRFLAAKLYSLKAADELIFFNDERLSQTLRLDLDELNFQVVEFIKKRYFEEVSSESIQFEGKILRANPVVAPILQDDLKKSEESDAVKVVANDLLSQNLDAKYGYNQALLAHLGAIKSDDLARMLARDLYETVIALAMKSYKSALILSGSIVEAVLLDGLLARSDLAIAALGRILLREGKELRSEDKQLDRWVLDRLLDVALEADLVSQNLYHWCHGLRGFRNLVHPGVEQRLSIEVSRENAEMAWNVVRRLLSEVKAKSETS